jgi:hypothetical protein
LKCWGELLTVLPVAPQVTVHTALVLVREGCKGGHYFTLQSHIEDDIEPHVPVVPSTDAASDCIILFTVLKNALYVCNGLNDGPRTWEEAEVSAFGDFTLYPLVGIGIEDFLLVVALDGFTP